MTNNNEPRSEECNFPDLSPSTAYKRKCRCTRCVAFKMEQQRKYRSNPEVRRRYNESQAALMRKRHAKAKQRED